MKAFAVLALVVLSASTGRAVLADVGERIHTGEAPGARLKPSSDSRPDLELILEAEARMTTVEDAMAVKLTGLRYVQDISDFEYLANVSIPNPSEGYKNAVGDFIATYVSSYVRSAADIAYLLILESRAPTVKQAIRVKEAGLPVVGSIEDFLDLIPFSIPNPSETYENEVSAFVAANVGRGLSSSSRIRVILSVESYTKLVSHAMAVKNAALVAVHTKQQLLALAEFSVQNPSAEFRTAVNAFIRDNIGRYP